MPRVVPKYAGECPARACFPGAPIVASGPLMGGPSSSSSRCRLPMAAACRCVLLLPAGASLLISLQLADSDARGPAVHEMRQNLTTAEQQAKGSWRRQRRRQALLASKGHAWARCWLPPKLPTLLNTLGRRQHSPAACSAPVLAACSRRGPRFCQLQVQAADNAVNSALPLLTAASPAWGGLHRWQLGEPKVHNPRHCTAHDTLRP